jgi:DNA-binding transcriptional LysR family regulator
MRISLRHLKSKLRMQHLLMLMLMLMLMLALLSEQRSLRAVAESLALTQPAVASALKEVERLFETPLFHRDGHVWIPTDAGRRVVRMARDALAGIERTVVDVEAISAGATGAFIVACPTGIVLPGIAEVLVAVQRSTGAHSLRIVQIEPGSPHEALAEARVDLAISVEDLGQAAGIAFIDVPQWHDTLAVVASAAPVSAMTQAHRRAQAQWVLPPRPDLRRLRFEAAWAMLGLPSPVLIETEPHLLEHAVLSSTHAVTVMQSTLALDLVTEGRARIVDLGLDLGALADWRIHWRSGEEMAAAVAHTIAEVARR